MRVVRITVSDDGERVQRVPTALDTAFSMYKCVLYMLACAHM